jgi:tetratricopeptide (TPR) repeat protein
MTAETGKISKKLWLKVVIFSLLVVLAAAAGVATRWLNDKNGTKQAPATTGLPRAVTDLEQLRDKGDQAAFSAKLQETLNDPSLDSGTRYLVYVEQGHHAMQNGQFQAAVDAYTKALDMKQDKQVAALLGDAYAALGDKARATEFYNKAIALIPEDYVRRDALRTDYENRITALDEGSGDD